MQLFGCRAIVYLVGQHGSTYGKTASKYKDLILGKGGTKLVETALRNHPGNAELQRAGSLALAFLDFRSWTCYALQSMNKFDFKYKARFGEISGILSLVLRSRPDAEVEVTACAFLGLYHYMYLLADIADDPYQPAAASVIWEPLRRVTWA